VIGGTSSPRLFYVDAFLEELPPTSTQFVNYGA
jgi:hypothetical protein